MLAALSLAIAPFLYAIHAKPQGAGKTGRAGVANAASSGDVTRGPRGKHEIALTFDGGADAECFDDLITALGNANAHSTFIKTVRRHEQSLKSLQKPK
jgi:hypothetical protein